MAKMISVVHWLRMALLVMIVVSTGGAYANNKIVANDSLLTNIREKQICEMSDGEFRCFFESQKDIDDFNPCDDNFLKEVFGKEIKEMTSNEFEYFDEFILECENVVPCSLMQYLLIKDKQPFFMTNNELEFYENCTDDCNKYMEKYHPTKKQRRKKYFRIIGISAAVTGGLLGLIVCALWPQGYK